MQTFFLVMTGLLNELRLQTFATGMIRPFQILPLNKSILTLLGEYRESFTRPNAVFLLVSTSG